MQTLGTPLTGLCTQISRPQFSPLSLFMQTSIDNVDLKQPVDTLQSQQKTNREDEIPDYEYYNDVQRSCNIWEEMRWKCKGLNVSFSYVWFLYWDFIPVRYFLETFFAEFLWSFWNYFSKQICIQQRTEHAIQLMMTIALLRLKSDTDNN